MDDRQLIADLLSALEYHTEQTRPIEFSKVAIQAAREHLQQPAQRTWVGLTRDEVETLSYQAEGNTWTAVELAEAKLKEKNT
jgi:uncharacterized protein YecT (DUF1311 family)